MNRQEGNRLKRLSKKQLKEQIDAYIAADAVKSLAGLALSLGINRPALLQMQSGAQGDPVAYAKTCIEKDLVENGLRGKYNATMASFILKCSFGYRDKTEDAKPGAVKIELADELRAYAD